ncbi:MAG TPA: PilZ domain-containing protein [Polyangiaceae bacterium]|nr:PilZ domain-containing protein [Polyangiaceae bacterium]
MAEDRRSARRARLSAVRATYEGATGERHQTEVLDLSRGGLFLKTAAPVAVGKRLSLEIHASGEASPWPALGRVVWIRAHAEGENRPAGMAVKLIDVEDSVSEAIDRLVQTREPTDRGIPRPAPPRERTILGVGLKPPEVPAAVVPVATVIVSEPAATVIVSEPPATPVPPPPPAPADSRLRNGGDPTRARAPTDPSIGIDRVGSQSGAPEKRARGVPNVAAEPPQDTATRRAAAGRTVAKKGRARGLIVALFILVAAALVAYAYRHALLVQWQRVAPAVHRALGH